MLLPPAAIWDLGLRIWDFLNPRPQTKISISPFLTEKFTGKFYPSSFR
ncbi:MAG: hypothetical protein M3Q78_05850 [Acidobacteriota bacterium]|nr:hypothetical protein [Acidobacteriota bacterium]